MRLPRGHILRCAGRQPAWAAAPHRRPDGLEQTLASLGSGAGSRGAGLSALLRPKALLLAAGGRLRVLTGGGRMWLIFVLDGHRCHHGATVTTSPCPEAPPPNTVTSRAGTAAYDFKGEQSLTPQSPFPSTCRGHPPTSVPLFPGENLGAVGGCGSWPVHWSFSARIPPLPPPPSWAPPTLSLVRSSLSLPSGHSAPGCPLWASPSSLCPGWLALTPAGESQFCRNPP